MKENLLVSVVLPIYKTEAYLQRCIGSVVNQTYRNLEIILVDDGSPDNCPAICDDWTRKDSRIKVVHKQNGGLGFARNTGIENATGDYICFFDSDDYIEPTTIELCCRSAEATGADVVCFGNDQVTQEGCVMGTRIPTPPKYVFAGDEIRELVIPNLLYADETTGRSWNLAMSAWCSIFSMDLIRRHNWRFVSEREILSEDYYSILDLYRYVRKLSVLPDVLYHYSVNPLSLSRVYRKDRYERIVGFTHAMLELADQVSPQIPLRSKVEKIYFGFTIGALKQIQESSHSFSEKCAMMKDIIYDAFLQRVLRENDFSQENILKRLLVWAMRDKRVKICYAMIMARNIIDTFRARIFQMKNKSSGR